VSDAQGQIVVAPSLTRRRLDLCGTDVENKDPYRECLPMRFIGSAQEKVCWLEGIERLRQLGGIHCRVSRNVLPELDTLLVMTIVPSRRSMDDNSVLILYSPRVRLFVRNFPDGASLTGDLSSLIRHLRVI
jgi:hypothetical protein